MQRGAVLRNSSSFRPLSSQLYQVLIGSRVASQPWREFAVRWCAGWYSNPTRARPARPGWDRRGSDGGGQTSTRGALGETLKLPTLPFAFAGRRQRALMTFHVLDAFNPLSRVRCPVSRASKENNAFRTMERGTWPSDGYMAIMALCLRGKARVAECRKQLAASLSRARSIIDC